MNVGISRVWLKAVCPSTPSPLAALRPASARPRQAFNAALLREQYRALARLGPYIHGIVILAALAFFCATKPTGSLLAGVVLPASLIAVSAFRLVCWFNARAGVEFEALDRIRRKVRVASVLGPR